MLYHLHEMHRQAMKPLLNWSECAYKLLTSPICPLAHTPFSQSLGAGYELLFRLGKIYDKPRFGIEHVTHDDQTFTITEKIVSSQPFSNLIHFEKSSAAGSPLPRQPVILLVAPLSGHHATLLRDTVKALLPMHDLYITDWLDAKNVPLSKGNFHLSDYILYVQHYIRTLGAEVNVIAICQPTVPVLAAVALMASANDIQPRTLTLMGGPIDGRISPTEVNRLAAEKNIAWFRDNLIVSVPHNHPGAGRKVYPGFLQHAAFIAMNPDLHAKSYQDFYRNLVVHDPEPASTHRRFYDEYHAVLDMDENFYLETIETVFQKFLLPNGSWVVNGNPVRPQDITSTRLLTVEGEMDDICGLGQTKAAQALCSGIAAGRKSHYIVEGAGHFGVFSGRRWRELVAPRISAFIAQRDPGVDTASSSTSNVKSQQPNLTIAAG
jgi:poly(3-hydroxybutyrate) depolymerase